MAYIPVTKISHLLMLCHKVIPLVYDESLSYYESLCKVAQLLNECIDAVNDINSNVDDLNSRVNTVEEKVNNIDAQLDTFIETINAQFAELEDKINADVDAKLAEVDYKLAEVDATVKDLKIYIDSVLANLEKELTDIINSQLAIIYEDMANFKTDMRIYVKAMVDNAIRDIPDITSVMVYDPTTGYVVGIQTALNNLYEDTRYFALTVDEYNQLHLSCNDLKTVALKGTSIPRGMTVKEWMTKARLWLWKNPAHHMYKFMTGKYVEYKENIILNNDLHRVAGCLTVDEYNQLGLTVDEINALNITCYEWAWRSNRIAFN